MFYVLNLILSCLIFYFLYLIRPKNYGYILASLLVVTLWTLLLGSQYFVGTDYQNYLTIFSNENSLEYYKNVKQEYGFYYFVKAFTYLGFKGQDFFYLFYFLTSIVFFKFVSAISRKDVIIYIFLFVTVSSLFHYQMNGLRQCTAVFFVSLGLVEFYRKKYLSFALIFVIAALIHKSAVLILPLFWIFNRIKFSWKQLSYLVLISSLISLIPLDNIIDSSLVFIADFQYLGDYGRYQDGSDYVQDISFLNKLTKLVYLPFYLYIIRIYIKKTNISILNDFEIKLFKIGILSYVLRNIFLISSITNRLGLFFTLLSIIPLYFLIRELLVRKDKATYTLVIVIFLAFYILKVVFFPTEVYSYDSVFFK